MTALYPVESEATKRARASKRICVVCKHPMCPFCGDWCDTLVRDDDEDDDCDLCCDGQCAWVQLP